jgi:GntR family transcriptional regulator
MNITNDKSKLDPNSYTPLYAQMADILRKSIEDGQYKAGEKLPSENELGKQFGISRITATAALEELVKAHLAYRERGRGTFVAKAVLSNFSFFSSFTEDMRARGLEPSSLLVSLHTQEPDLEMIERLKIEMEAPYYCLKRIRFANQEPVVFQSAFLPKDMYPGFEQIDFKNQSLYEVMRNSYGFMPTWGDAIVEAGIATSEEASYLDISPRAPVLIIWHITLDDRFIVLEYVRSVYRSDRFSFATGRNPLRHFSK